MLPSKEYFSLGKTKPFTGDMNEPGVIEGLIKVNPLRRVMKVSWCSESLFCGYDGAVDSFVSIPSAVEAWVGGVVRGGEGTHLILYKPYPQ